jgi:hypothetical protein
LRIVSSFQNSLDNFDISLRCSLEDAFALIIHEPHENLIPNARILDAGSLKPNARLDNASLRSFPSMNLLDIASIKALPPIFPFLH